jgi:hypothetical protein
MLAWNLLFISSNRDKIDYQKEEVMEVLDFGGIPEDSLEEIQVGNDMLFRLNPMKEIEKESDDPMWSSSSALPSDWLFGDE